MTEQNTATAPTTTTHQASKRIMSRGNGHAAGATTATLQLPALATLRVGGGASATEGVLAQCLDPSGDPFRAFPRDGVCLLPPGRYRFENATPVELDLRAGETAEIALH